MHQKNPKFVITGTLKISVLSMNQHLCNGCHGLMQKAVSFNDVAIVYVKGSAYRIHFWYKAVEYRSKSKEYLNIKTKIIRTLNVEYSNIKK